LTPDDFLLPLIQAAVAIENIKAKDLSNEKKIDLFVRRDDFALGRSDNPWHEIFSEFRKIIAQPIGKDEYDLYRGDFSTTKTLQQYDLAFMDACKSRFSYGNIFSCGIPCIRLTGSIEDWEQFEERSTRTVQKFAKDVGEDWQIAILKAIQKIGKSGRKILSRTRWLIFGSHFIDGTLIQVVRG